MNQQVRRVHFIGICGTAMGAVAAAMQEQGFAVTGSDEKVYPPMSDFLEAKGIPLKEGFSPANIPADADVIVVGNAIGRGNPELEEVLNRHLCYQSLPETLRHYFLRGRRNLVVAGTHGKTTTAAMLTHILRTGGFNPAYMIGGIAEDLGQGASLHESEFTVLEGDEYDTAFFDKGPKFAHYLPELAILNAVELDQMDIYPDLAAVKKAFGILMRVLPENGVLIFNSDDPNACEVAAEARARTRLAVGLGTGGKFSVSRIEYQPHGSHFTLLETRFSLPVVGEIYVRNTAMAIVAAHHCGVPLPAIAEATASFRGVRRRQVLRGERNGVKIVEDFGKHPTNIRETIKALRHRFPGARVWAAVDPRSNTMCRAAIHRQLTDALAHADGALISAVDRPERFKPGESLEPARIARDLNEQGREAFAEPDPEAIAARLAKLVRPGDVVVLFSSGSFGGLCDMLLRQP
jgi:UDP-N-acetylmuramate: L-alanyl-gamma-D-glutamyl-meso-diaminopimelate ligase